MAKLSIKLCLIIIGCLAVPAAFASVDSATSVESPFMAQIGGSDLALIDFDLAPYFELQDSLELDEKVIQTEVPVKLTGMKTSFRIQSHGSQTRLGLGQTAHFEMLKMDAKLHIKSLSVDAIVEKVVSGVLLRVHVVGACENIEIEASGAKETGLAVQGDVRAALDNDGLPVVDLQSFAVGGSGHTTNSATWKIADFNCAVGGLSFRDQVRSALQIYLSDSKNLQENLLGFLRSRLKLLNEEIRGKIFAVREVRFSMPQGRDEISSAQLVIRVLPEVIARVGNPAQPGLRVSGRIELEFVPNDGDRIEKAARRVLRVPGLAEAATLDSERTLLSVPVGFLSALNQLAFASQTYFVRKVSTEVSGFQSLLENPLLGFFVWPQLTLYPAQTKFYLDAWTDEKPLIGEWRESNGELSSPLSARIKSSVWAPSDLRRAYLNMTNFGIGLGARINLSMVPSGLRLQMSNARLRVSAAWGQAYVDDVKRSRGFLPFLNLDVIANGIQDYLEGAEFVIPLGGFRVTDRWAFEPRELRLQKNWIVFY